MTNITTLTATLKLAAQEEIMCRKASDTSDLWQDEASPENILVVVEALEKARVDGNEYAASERAVAVKNVELQDEFYGLKARIAELESRTVKLPEPISVLHRRDFNDAHRAIYAYPEAEVDAALASAGIGKGE